MIGRRKVIYPGKEIPEKKEPKSPTTKTSKPKEATELFWDAIIHSSSLVILCEFCGRVHFATYSEHCYDEEAELIELRKKAKKNPNKYIELNSEDMISWGHLEGKQIVYKCPCNSARKFEDWIWKHRRLISDYLNVRVRKLEKDLEREKELVVQLEGLE